MLDESGTETEQELKQKNVGSGESVNDNCGQNLIDSALLPTTCASVTVGPQTRLTDRQTKITTFNPFFLFSIFLSIKLRLLYYCAKD